MSESDLVEIAKQSGEFKKHYGKWWGGFIQLQFVNAAAGRRPFLWSSLIGIGTVILGFAVKYGLAYATGGGG